MAGKPADKAISIVKGVTFLDSVDCRIELNLRDNALKNYGFTFLYKEFYHLFPIMQISLRSKKSSTQKVNSGITRSANIIYVSILNSKKVLMFLHNICFDLNWVVIQKVDVVYYYFFSYFIRQNFNRKIFIVR